MAEYTSNWEIVIEDFEARVQYIGVVMSTFWLHSATEPAVSFIVTYFSYRNTTYILEWVGQFNRFSRLALNLYLVY